VSFQGVLGFGQIKVSSDDVRRHEIGDEHGFESEVADVRLTSLKINPVDKPVRSDGVDTGYISVC